MERVISPRLRHTKDPINCEQVGCRQPFLIRATDIFGNYKEFSYYCRVLDRIETLGTDGEQPTPAMMEQSPYKVHISLSADDYVKHKHAVIKILTSHLEQGATNDFKYVDNKLLVAKLKSVQQFLDWTCEYRAMLDKKEIPNSEFANKYIDAFLSAGYVKNGRFPSFEETNDVINKTENAIKSIKRYQESDQFTIYIPESFDQMKVLNLCDSLNRYFVENNVAPGKLSDVESRITDNINLRQDFLLSDFHAINEAGCVDMSLRIDAYIRRENDGEIRAQVLQEQQESEFYQFLYQQFN